VSYILNPFQNQFKFNNFTSQFILPIHLFNTGLKRDLSKDGNIYYFSFLYAARSPMNSRWSELLHAI